MSDNRYLRIYDLKQKIQHHPEVGTYVSEEDIDLMERTIIDENHVRHGKWIEHHYYDRRGFENGSYYECSECGFDKCDEPYPYCPECGARMDGGNSNE